MYRKCFFACVLALLLTLCLPGCGKAPEDTGITTEDSAGEVDTADLLSQLPEHVTKEIEVGSETQEIDEDVICTNEGDLKEGTFQEREFSEEEVREAVAASGFQAADESVSLSIDGSFLSWQDLDQDKGGRIEEAEEAEGAGAAEAASSSLADSCKSRIEALLAQLNVNQEIVSCEYGTRGGSEVFRYETSGFYNGIPFEWTDSTIAFSGNGEMTDGSLASFCIVADYCVESETTASLLPFDSILNRFAALLENGTIQCVSSGQPVETIKLCYMLEKTEGSYQFYPVWNFEVEYTADWLRGSSLEEATRYVVLDARTGELIDYNDGGA
ncbi:MAG: hypothetical protein LUF30_06555 [Lachnospiraceae bacterium]|nr:hypothetical protein [Lachnospiraceae bacterium]